MRHVALLTDFGMRDHYVAAMKGVIAARCDAAIDDLSHDIASFDVFEAAWFLRGCARYWPRRAATRPPIATTWITTGRWQHHSASRGTCIGQKK